jgi:hypothetical protein
MEPAMMELGQLFRRRGSQKKSQVNALRLGVESLEDRRMLTLAFNFDPVGNLASMLSGSQGVSAQQLGNNVVQGFTNAAEIWQSAIEDDVTLQIDIDFDSLGSGILGGTDSSNSFYSYSNVRSALLNDVSSVDDSLSSSSLQISSDIDLVINRTANNPNGFASSTPYLDNDGDSNNTLMNLTNANAKAIGLLSPHATGLDAFITFSNQYTWDFDSSNGIGVSSYDFVAVATHEIGHSLGFLSGVDVLDYNSPNPTGPTYYNDHSYTFVSALDLFRYSSTSFGVGSGIIDWSADTRTKYFSIDGGATQLATFSTGDIHGDGEQASHWKDGLGIGLMDPSLTQGTTGSVTPLDVTALDVIGWDRFLPAVAQVTISGPNSVDGNRATPDGSYDVPDGSGEQLRTVPVGGANELSIKFNKAVTMVSGDLDLTTLTGSPVPSVGSFTAPSSLNDFTATWTFSTALPAAQYLISLSDAVVDSFGQALDGEWVNPFSVSTADAAISEFPSGDGYAGGDFNFVFTILPGDANRDNFVGGADWIIYQSSFGGLNLGFDGADYNGDGVTNSTDHAFWNQNYGLALNDLIFADFDANGIVNSLDLSIWSSNYGTTGTHADGDANGDGDIDGEDWIVVQRQIGLELDWVA